MEKEIQQINIGAKLKELREYHGLSLRGMAEKIGTNKDTIQKMEGSQFPDMEKTLKILLCFNEDLGLFLGTSLSSDERILIDKYRQMPTKKKEGLLKIVE